MDTFIREVRYAIRSLSKARGFARSRLVVFYLFPPLAAAQRERWIATWTAGPEPAEPDPNQPSDRQLVDCRPFRTLIRDSASDLRGKPDRAILAAHGVRR